MCSRILRAHALELGLDPEFTVIEESVAGPLMDRAVDIVVSRERDGLRELQQWYPLSGEKDPKGFEAGASVKRLVRVLLERASASALRLRRHPPRPGAVDFSGLMDAYRPCLGASPKAAEIARTALDALEAFLEGPQTRGDLAACMLACGVPRASKAFPKEQVAWLKAEAADAFVNAYLALGGPALDELLALARAVGREYDALKAERSALDNNDLLRLTYEALRDRPGVRDAYAGKFAMVMIDEFQDTDQQQVDLIGFLTGAGGRALCTVGDASSRSTGSAAPRSRCSVAPNGASRRGRLRALRAPWSSSSRTSAATPRCSSTSPASSTTRRAASCRASSTCSPTRGARTAWSPRVPRAGRRCSSQAGAPTGGRRRRPPRSPAGSASSPTRGSPWAGWYCCWAACLGRACTRRRFARRASTA